jgi:hypothetical protein
MPDGWIYFICNREMTKVKIGRAVKPIERIKAINSQHPDGDLQLLAAIPFVDYKAIEKHLHVKFFKHHLRNEWFTLHADIRDYIEEASDGVITLHDMLAEWNEPLPIEDLSLDQVCADPVFVLLFSSDRSYFDHAHEDPGEVEDCCYCTPDGGSDADRQATVD